jgi:hypothetical protein
VEVRFGHFIWIEELLALVESALIGGERDIDSVESVCRRVGQVLAEHGSISWFKVVVENFAHGYTTFATISNARFDHTVQTGAEARVLQTQ